jgi:HPt (histidine-containing phosphotransfer) domain-containing protein
MMTYQSNNKKPVYSATLRESVILADAVDFSVMADFEDSDDDSDLVVELIDLFLNDVPQRLELMREAEVVRNLAVLRSVAHGLKGSSASLGAGTMATLCDEVEASSGSMSSKDMKPLLTRLEQEFERVRLAFSAERFRSAGQRTSLTINSRNS